MYQRFLNIFFLLSLISMPTFCGKFGDENIWKTFYEQYGHHIKMIDGHLFEPVCGGGHVPNSNLELFTQMAHKQTYLWKLIIGNIKMPLHSNNRYQQHQTSHKLEENKMANHQMNKFNHKTDEENIQNILEKLSIDNGQMESLHKIMGEMENAKKMLNQKEKLMKLFHNLQVDLKTILDKENDQHSLPPLKMDILSIIKNGAELIIVQFNGGNECKNVDKEKAKHNQENTFRLLYLITKLKENDFMQIPAGRKGIHSENYNSNHYVKDRRRRRRKRQYSLIIIAVIALAFVGAIGLGCFYLNKIKCCNEDSGEGGGENNA